MGGSSFVFGDKENRLLHLAKCRKSADFDKEAINRTASTVQQQILKTYEEKWEWELPAVVDHICWRIFYELDLGRCLGFEGTFSGDAFDGKLPEGEDAVSFRDLQKATMEEAQGMFDEHDDAKR